MWWQGGTCQPRGMLPSICWISGLLLTRASKYSNYYSHQVWNPSLNSLSANSHGGTTPAFPTTRCASRKKTTISTVVSTIISLWKERIICSTWQDVCQVRCQIKWFCKMDNVHFPLKDVEGYDMKQGKWLIIPRNVNMESNTTQYYPGWYPVPRRTYQLMSHRKRGSYFASQWISANIRSRHRQATYNLNSNSNQIKMQAEN